MNQLKNGMNVKMLGETGRTMVYMDGVSGNILIFDRTTSQSIVFSDEIVKDVLAKKTLDGTGNTVLTDPVARESITIERADVDTIFGILVDLAR